MKAACPIGLNHIRLGGYGKWADREKSYFLDPIEGKGEDEDEHSSVSFYPLPSTSTLSSALCRRFEEAFGETVVRLGLKIQTDPVITGSDS